MTMLDRMRRHKAWLKWSLAVVVAAFILLYVPQFLSGNDVTSTTAVIATVDGREITAGVYQQRYLQQVSQIQAQYSGMTDEVLRQLGVGERLVQELVSQQAVLVEAERLGITVSDGELKERLIRLPMFQQNGQFVGEETYRQMLALGRPPILPAEFERELRQSLIAEKLAAAVTGWIRASDQEVETEYRRRHEQVQLDLAVLTADQFQDSVEPTDEDLVAHYSANQESYRVPEKRRVRYLEIDAEALRAEMTVTPEEVEARYQSSIQTYSTPEQVRASHILFQTEGNDEAEVRARAEDVLAQVQAGGDFAELAREYSEDTASQANGGDLDFFGPGAMVREFEDAAWALEPGETSGLVTSPFGLHIIRVTDRRPAVTRTLDEVRGEIEDGIRFEKARAEAARIVGELEPQINAPEDLDRVAADRGLTVGDSGLFSREEPLAGLGFAPAVSAEAFVLSEGEVSGALNTNQGYAFMTVAEVVPSYLPTLEEASADVREDVVRTMALDMAASRAETIASASNFTAAARTAGATIHATDLVARGSALPEIGISAQVDEAAFALDVGGITDPIATDDTVVVARVGDRQDISLEALDAQRETLRAELTELRRNAFFEAYMQKARTRMAIQYNDAVLTALLGA